MSYLCKWGASSETQEETAEDSTRYNLWIHEG
jgi:hypothetical protein